jgi:hypothetical protein
MVSCQKYKSSSTVFGLSSHRTAVIRMMTEAVRLKPRLKSAVQVILATTSTPLKLFPRVVPTLSVQSLVFLQPLHKPAWRTDIDGPEG